MTKLGVNVDHIATLREARQAFEPDPVAAALLAELAGADGITIHPRCDRRHIKDRDVSLLRQVVTTRLNIEMAATKEMLALAEKIGPDTVTLVPEREEEITTEGGLDVANNRKGVEKAIQQLHRAGLEVSLFIDPQHKQIESAAAVGAEIIEINTATYSETVPKGLKETNQSFQNELGKIVVSARAAESLGLQVLAGHGLTYRNVYPVSTIPQIVELNIGHNIVARASMVGIERAVGEMLVAMRGGTTV